MATKAALGLQNLAFDYIFVLNLTDKSRNKK